MTIHIETPRLILRELRPEDDQGMFELDSNPAVLTYLGTEPQTDIEQSRAVIRFVQSQYENYGIGRFAMVLKDTNEFMGWAGLKYVTEPINDHINYYDIGYRLIERYWGKGYATEAAQASLHYGFQDLKLDKICGITMSTNYASQAILQKIGLRHINDFTDRNMSLKWFEAVKPG